MTKQSHDNSDDTFLLVTGAMVVSVTAGVAVLSAVEPLELGLEGVWAGLALLMTGRLVTLVWRYQQLDGPLPPLLAADADESDNEE